MIKPHEMISGRYGDQSGKQKFIHDLFKKGARHYDRINRIGFFGTGHFYRKSALKRAGLEPGMKALDVACGTGAVTRAAVEILGDSESVFAVDPNEGMMGEAKKNIDAQFQQGDAENLPCEDNDFDFLSMGYALRHVEDLVATFEEYKRVLKPGGKLLVLEITRPKNRFVLFFNWLYFGLVLPQVTFLVTWSKDAREMMSYYWETIDACVPPELILEAMEKAGFQEIKRNVSLGIFSEYTAWVDE